MKPKWNELDEYTFDNYVADFRLSLSSQEYVLRKGIFDTELLRVKAHNKKNLSWKEGINKFSMLNTEEKRVSQGLMSGAYPKHMAVKNYHRYDETSATELPNSIDWRDYNIITPVKDQGACGSCWAFAAAEIIESYVAKKSGLLSTLSIQQMVSCSSNPYKCGGNGGCDGSISQLGWQYVIDFGGIYSDYQYPYTSGYTNPGQSLNCSVISDRATPVAIISDYVDVPSNNYDAAINALANIGPLSVVVSADHWGAYETGIFNGCDLSTNAVLDHGVVLVGYGSENGQSYYLVRNSWGTEYGESGYIRLARSDNESSICGIDTSPQEGTGCAMNSSIPVTVCGTCGILYNPSYVIGANTYSGQSYFSPTESPTYKIQNVTDDKIPSSVSSENIVVPILSSMIALLVIFSTYLLYLVYKKNDIIRKGSNHESSVLLAMRKL